MLRTVDFGLPSLSLGVAGKNGDRPLLRHLEAADSGGISSFAFKSVSRGAGKRDVDEPLP